MKRKDIEKDADFGGFINIKDPENGQYYNVPVKKSFNKLNWKQKQQAIEQVLLPHFRAINQESWGDFFLGGASTALKGVTLGVSDFVSPSLRHYSKKFEKHHPYLSTGVELVAGVAPVFATGGTALAAKGALTGGKYALGKVAAKEIAKDVGKVSLKGLTKKAAASPVGKATEKALSTAWQGINKAAYNTPVAMLERQGMKMFPTNTFEDVAGRIAFTGGLGAGTYNAFSNYDNGNNPLDNFAKGSLLGVIAGGAGIPLQYGISKGAKAAKHVYDTYGGKNIEKRILNHLKKSAIDLNDLKDVAEKLPRNARFFDTDLALGAETGLLKNITDHPDLALKARKTAESDISEIKNMVIGEDGLLTEYLGKKPKSTIPIQIEELKKIRSEKSNPLYEALYEKEYDLLEKPKTLSNLLQGNSLDKTLAENFGTQGSLSTQNKLINALSTLDSISNLSGVNSKATTKLIKDWEKKGLSKAEIDTKLNKRLIDKIAKRNVTSEQDTAILSNILKNIETKLKRTRSDKTRTLYTNLKNDTVEALKKVPTPINTKISGETLDQLNKAKIANIAKSEQDYTFLKNKGYTAKKDNALSLGSAMQREIPEFEAAQTAYAKHSAPINVLESVEDVVANKTDPELYAKALRTHDIPNQDEFLQSAFRERLDRLAKSYPRFNSLPNEEKIYRATQALSNDNVLNKVSKTTETNLDPFLKELTAQNKLNENRLPLINKAIVQDKDFTEATFKNAISVLPSMKHKFFTQLLLFKKHFLDKKTDANILEFINKRPLEAIEILEKIEDIAGKDNMTLTRLFEAFKRTVANMGIEGYMSWD